MKKGIKLLIVCFSFLILLTGYAYDEKTDAPSEDQFHEMVERLRESTVTVRIKSMIFNVGIGSGLIYQKDNLSDGRYLYYVVTNQHVVESATSVELLIGASGFEIGDVYASGEKEFANEDIAVIRFISTKVYPIVDISTSSNIITPLRLTVGQKVFAIGSPVSDYYSNAVSDIGIVTKQTTSFIIHTSNINPGNSGGPLFTMDGKFVGINTQKVETINGRVVDGIGEALSIDRVNYMIAERLKAVTPKLGININNSDRFLNTDYKAVFESQADNFRPQDLIPRGVDGIVVVDTSSTRPSYNKLLQFDLITAVNGVGVKTQEELAAQLGTIAVGNVYTFQVHRKIENTSRFEVLNVTVTI